MKKCVVVLLTVVFLLDCTASAALAFSDTRGHWANRQINHLHSRELVSGYPDASFRPDAFITRQEFVTLLVKTLNKGKEGLELQKGESSFKDASASWGKGYIEVAHELNITHGDGQGSFNPDRLITREEAVTMLVNSLDKQMPEAGELPFTDNEDVSSWGHPAVSYAVNHNLISGFPDGTLRPKNYLTRAEVTVLLENFLEFEGRKYHFYGTLVDINLGLRQAIFKIDGREEIFEFAENVVVYREGNNIPVTELALPKEMYFNLNPAGKLTYAVIAEKAPASGKVKLKYTHLPSHQALIHASPDAVAFREEDEEFNPSREAMRDPGMSLKITREAMRVNEFVHKTGANGRGQLVAVIDSGIDAGHPDLQITADGFTKILDFIDLTDEGKVTLSGEAQVEGNQVTIDGKEINFNGIKRQDDLIKYGYLSTASLPASIKDNLPENRLLVVAVASQYLNIFDTIYLDTNSDGQIKDEIPLRKYSEQHQVAFIPGEKDKRLNLVVSGISQEENYVKFGFDCLGHGTQVAGIVAASGEIEGVAPGAQLLPIKVMNSLGLAYLDRLENAMRLAAESGASVAVLSMGQYQLTAQERQELVSLASKMWNTYGMLICMAGGNNGPGLGTVASSAAIKNVISVGAYATPDMWQHDYGWRLEKPSLWYFSSSGPAVDGLIAPVLVAPGSAVSTYPMWGDSLYRLDQGTSIAAPHVAGAAALLMDVVTHKLYMKDAMAVYQGLIAGAEPLPGFEAVEQGYGAVNLMLAWQELQNIKDEYVSYKVEQYSPDYGYGKGLYSRELQPARLLIKIANQADENKHLAVGGLSPWIKPSQYGLQIPARGERTIEINYEGFDEPGLYSDFLVAEDYKTPGWEVSALQTVVVPYRLEEMPDKQFESKEKLDAGQFKRYFFHVPEGTGRVKFSLEVGDKGRVCMHIISPAGSQDVTRYAGVGETQVSPTMEVSYDKPAAGTWEVIAYSSATLSAYDMTSSSYTLQACLEEVKEIKAQEPEKRYLVTAFPREFKPGEETTVTLHFWNAYTKAPAQGVVSINGKLYEIQNGLVQLELTPEKDTIPLTISW